MSNTGVISNDGTQNHWKGLARKVTVFIVFFIAYLFVVFFPLAVIDNVLWRPGFYASAQDTALVISNVLMFGLFFYYHHRTGNRWINEEAQRFLAKRTLKRGIPGSLRRNKMLGSLLWAPTLVVLAVFLFFPEALGITSHLFGGLAPDHQRLEIPLTWIIADNATSIDTATNAEVGRSIWVVAGKGIGRVGIGRYWRKEEPVSEMTFSSYPASRYEPKPPALSNVLSRVDMPFGSGVLICWDIIPFARTRPEPLDPKFAEIVCDSTTNGFHASFSGWRTDLSRFNKLLKEAHVPEPTPDKSDYR